MNKTQLIESMAAESGLTKADAGKALDAFINSVSRTNGDDLLKLYPKTGRRFHTSGDCLLAVSINVYSAVDHLFPSRQHPAS